MCGRTSLFVPPSDLAERFGATPPDALEPRYNIAPGDDLAVITDEHSDRIDLFQWGLVPHWADDPDDSHRPINARAETAREKASFREPFASRRCLVLADGFYEWQSTNGGPKRPYRIALDDDVPFAMAGLWDRWDGDGDPLETVTVVTTDANDLVAPIHDRMPVILAPDEEATWLSADDPDAAQSLLDPYDGADLRAYEIARDVNDPSNDSPAIIEPLESQQSGLDEFA